MYEHERLGVWTSQNKRIGNTKSSFLSENKESQRIGNTKTSYLSENKESIYSNIWLYLSLSILCEQFIASYIYIYERCQVDPYALEDGDQTLPKKEESPHGYLHVEHLSSNLRKSIANISNFSLLEILTFPKFSRFFQMLIFARACWYFPWYFW